MVRNKLVSLLVFAIAVLGANPSALGARGDNPYPYHSDSPCAQRKRGTSLFQKLGQLGSHRPYHIAVILKNLDDAHWRQIKRGVRAAAEKENVDITVKAASGASGKASQLQLAQGLTDKKFDAYIVAPETRSNLAPALRKMRKQGAPIINVEGARIAATTFVGPDHELEGSKAALKFSNLFAHSSNIHKLFFPTKTKVAQVEGLLSSHTTILRIEGFDEGIGKSDNLDLVESISGRGEAQKAYDAAETIIRQYPDVKGIYANDDKMALGIAQAVEAADKDIAVVGTGGDTQAISAIRQGALTATISSLPYYEGFWAVESAIRLLHGQQLPAWVVAPAQIITQHNVHLFYDNKNNVRADLYR